MGGCTSLSHILSEEHDFVILSSRVICLSVRHTLALYQNVKTYRTIL